MMFCVGELMKHKENSPGGAGSSRTGGTGDPLLSPERNATGGQSSQATQSPSTPGMKLVKGKRYRIMVISARLPSRKPTGKAWDINSGLPDCFFSLRTPENHYKSSMVSDCLVPNWSDKSLFVTDLWSGRVRVANEGAVFIYDPDSNSNIHLDFSDSDLTMNDSIASLVIKMHDLKAGYTEYRMSISTNSLSINTSENQETPDMLFTIRIIPDGL